MKKHTLEDIKNSQNTLAKFFYLQGKAELNMINDAFQFYSKFSKHKREKKKTFTKKFSREVEYYNTAIK
jgi:methyltransferase-like protein